jgi:glycine betaine/proline transport system substrate-binding protein
MSNDHGAESLRRTRRTRRTGRTALATLAASALLLAACGGGQDDGGNTLRLVANPWPGSYANAHVAAAILAQELGIDAQIVEIDENAQWAGLDDGTLDASLEVWPSGHADNYATYVDELGTVEDGGPLGALGQIGWFLPSALLKEHPELASWEGLRGRESLFSTSETGTSGQFLAADPSFVQFDDAIIANLGLDLIVIQSGSEAAQLAAVDAAIGRGDPVLFYFYTPHWLHARYDLTQVQLPAWSQECEDRPAAQRDCGYPGDVLAKVFTAGLAERLPDAYTLLSRMRLTNDDQDMITFAMDVEGLDAAVAARAWVDANEAVWRTWLP